VNGLHLVLARDITERSLLRLLIAGFGLVLLLLCVAGVGGVRGTREIQSNAEHLVREELIIARLLNEVQEEEATLTAVLHELVRGDRAGKSNTLLLRQLARADASIHKASLDASRTGQAEQWRRLENVVRDFSHAASRALANGDRSQQTIDRLFVLHDSAVAVVRSLVRSSTDRASRIDQVLAVRSRDLATESFGLLGSCFLLSLVCAGLTVRMAGNTIRRMESQSAELSEVSWQLVRTQEDTARRFSHELHDELGQSLAAIKANLTGIHEGNLERRRTDCLHLVDDAIYNVRELSQLLRPVLLDDFGLDAALRWLTDGFAERTGIELDYRCNLTGRLADDTETHLFRIAQEALTNIARHSGATRVKIALEENRGVVEMQIQDNGRGLAVPEVPWSPSLGMVGMRARARKAGGELKVSTPDGGGLVIAVSVPAARQA
jgi:two-component system sensor histidine kinase UhpB